MIAGYILGDSANQAREPLDTSAKMRDWVLRTEWRG